MKLLWLAPLVQIAGRPNHFRPLMDEVATAEGNFPNVWQTTTANAALRPFRFAVGLAEVTTQQRNAINTTPGIVAVDGEFLFGDAPPAVPVFGNLPAALQTNINERVINLLGLAPAEPGETIRQLLDRALESIAPGLTLNALVNQLAQQWGI